MGGLPYLTHFLQGGVGAKCDFWKPMGRTTGGEELNRDPRRLVTPTGSADKVILDYL